jgi:metal-responsive CopG/Arc/MetJ family transcriptional regulator
VKTAISIPDAIFQEAERVAKRRGMSRSELYAKAVDEYVKSERLVRVRERLNVVYGRDGQESRLTPTLAAAQSESLDQDDW